MNYFLYLLCLVASVLLEVKGQVQVQLIGGSNSAEGFVLLRYNGTWGTICDDDWDKNDAIVICRMAGFGNAISVTAITAANTAGTTFSGGSQLGSNVTILLDNVRCIGSESDITQCQHNGWGVHDCSTKHLEDAGVVCTLPPAPNTTTSITPTRGPCGSNNDTVRLVGSGLTGVGRVEIKRNGVWGTVCDDRFDTQDAQVICRTMCFHPSDALLFVDPTMLNESTSLPIHLDELSCMGHESVITDCTHAGWGTTDCTHREDVLVACVPYIVTPKPVPDPKIMCTTEAIQLAFPLVGDTYPMALDTEMTNCSTVTTNQTHMVISVPFIGCGTQREINQTHVIYRNTILQKEDTSGSILISRGQNFNIEASCVLPREKTVGDSNGFTPFARTVAPLSATQEFDISMYFYNNQSFDRVLNSFPVRLALGDWLYVGVVLKITDQTLKLIVPQCYATPTMDKQSGVRYNLIKDKCRKDTTLTYFPLGEDVMNFRFQIFKFVGNYSEVYIHCDTVICALSEKSQRCDRSCGVSVSAGRRKRRNAEVTSIEKYPKTYHVQQGPYMVVDSADLDRSIGKNEGQPSSGGRPSVLGNKMIALYFIVILLGKTVYDI